MLAWRDWNFVDVNKANANIVNTGNIRSFGDGRDVWAVEFNNMLSPWSNPNTNDTNGTSSNLAVQVLGGTDTTTTLKFWFLNPRNGPPAKPQNLQVSAGNFSSVYHPVLTWEKNLEPDVDSLGAYDIYRCSGTTCTDLVKVATVAGNVQTWTDTVTLVDHYSYTYRIKAVDTQDLQSVFSEHFILRATSGTTQGGGGGTGSGKQVAPSLEQAAEATLQVEPNPTSDEVRINYSITEEGIVTLRIFDAQGRQVAWPVDDYRQAGAHSEYLTVGQLPNGTYMCLLVYHGRAWIQQIVVTH